MAFLRWTKSRGYGCAVEGDECLAVSVRCRVSEKCLSVDEAWHGQLSDKAFTSRLARRLGRKPFWVPMMFSSETERNDVKVCAIDDADGHIRGSRLSTAVEAQLREVEANKSGDYVRTFLRFVPEGKRPHIVGASAPRATVDKTVAAWTAAGVLNPCVGSVRAGVVNLFLALHPASAAAEPLHRLLAYRAIDADLFCYLQGQALMDSGASPWNKGSGGFESLLDHMGEWGSEFAKKYQLTRGDVMRAYVLGGEATAFDAEIPSEEPLEFWTVPWDESVTFSSPAVRKTVLDHRQLALSALGLALHGV